MNTYEIFVRNLDEIEENVEVIREIRDASTYQIKVVKALFCKTKESLPGSESIYIRALVGHLLDKEPWRIKIIKVLEEQGEQKNVKHGK